MGHLRVHLGGRGEFTLDAGESKSFDWRVRPHTVPQPASDDFDYWRWCVELEPGEYLVWFRWRIDKDFFDPDTHQHLSGLESLATQLGATVWQGQVISNRLRVVYG